MSSPNNQNSNRVIVLLSGGLDSATAAAVARREGKDIFCLSFRYGQRHIRELGAAVAVARSLGAAEHRTIGIDDGFLAGSALTDSTIEVPKDRDHRDMSSGVPATYVPGRNTLFLAYGLSWAEIKGAAEIFIGANALDYSGYPDCRPEYLEAFERMANLATRASFEGKVRLRVRAPLIRLTKAEIIRLGTELGVDYGLTWSCYDPGAENLPCGRCDSCLLRAKGFREAGLFDPLLRSSDLPAGTDPE